MWQKCDTCVTMSHYFSLKQPQVIYFRDFTHLRVIPPFYCGYCGKLAFLNSVFGWFFTDILRRKYIEIWKRICYNANRQSEMSSPCSSTTMKTPVLEHWGFSIPYFGMAGLRAIGQLPTIYRYLTIWWCNGKLHQPQQRQ